MGVEIKIKIKGEKQIDQNLRRMAANSTRIRNKALKKTGQVVGDKLEKSTRKKAYSLRKSSDRKWKAQRENEEKTGVKKKFPHLADDVAVGKPNQLGDIKIGYGEDSYWRAHFPEAGTIYQTGKHFIEQTENEVKNIAMEVLANELRKGLGL